jgi:hypothetical protein
LRAKEFFYVVLGIATLGIGYHFRANQAGAQGSPSLVAVLSESGTEHGFALDSSGRFFWFVGGVWSESPTRCPAGTPVDFKRGHFVELDPGNPGHTTSAFLVAMANGDVWAFPADTNPAQPWQFTNLGNPFGTVDARGRTWSAVKESYRK